VFHVVYCVVSWLNSHPVVNLLNLGSIECTTIVCMYVRTYVCVCMYLYMNYVYTCTMYVCTYICMYVYVYICMYEHIYIYMYICMYVCVYICMYEYMYVLCISICMYVCMYICNPRQGLDFILQNIHIIYAVLLLLSDFSENVFVDDYWIYSHSLG